MTLVLLRDEDSPQIVARVPEGMATREHVLRDLIHDVVQAIRRNLKVDWTEPHRDAVYAEIRASVKRVLRQRGVRAEDLEPFCDRLIEQARVMFADWPVAA